MNRWAMLACTLLVLAGCKKTEAPVGAAVSYAPRVDVSDPFGVEHPDLTLPPKSRAVKRLTVEQLHLPLAARQLFTHDATQGLIPFTPELCPRFGTLTWLQ